MNISTGSQVASADLTADPVAQAYAIAPLLREEAPKIEALGQLTPTVVDALHTHGLYRTLLPRSLNGYGADLKTFVRVIEALAAADASTAWCVGQAVGCSMAAAYVDGPVARRIWGDDPCGVLAWGFQLEGRAKVVPGGYEVTGKWGFGSGGHHASWMGAHCHVELPDGSLLKDANGALVERTMLLEQSKLNWTRNWDVVGLRGTGSDSYTLDGVFVPDAYTVRRDLGAERRIDEPLFQFTTTSAYSSGFAAVAMGIARAVMEDLKALAQTKKPSSTTRTLRDSPVMHHLIAENEAKLRSARAFVLETIRDAEDGIRQTGKLRTEDRMLMRLATTSAIKRAKEVAEFAYHEAGATAIFAANPFERRMRDIHAAAQQVQGRTGHIEVCGQWFLGLTPAARHL
ncbi:MAG TPA: acyl-CoA dehydrogenase family protein [Rhodopila sp.]|uniref:acyl-CoA dehydrogenase family protein n=1 Tax=Rhodopila sp. TaxID=2480087 RepID=UPI002BBF6393|nr:acyl-CoA dehydrogenase family protein [Rhodopila sp.]HVY17892.1 acyl-CoA dehydrogenase family protein [Rhodopila sp.]